jgi:cycloartenol synthase
MAFCLYGSTLGPFVVLINGYVLRKVLEDSPGDLNDWYRHTSKGAWPFSVADHGWPISDCNAEGLKVNSVISITNKEFYFTCLKF